MSSKLAQLSLLVEGKTVISPCVEIMALSKLPRDVAPQGYMRFYSAFLQRFGDRARYCQLEDSTRWKPFRAKDRLKLEGWFSDRRSLTAPLLGFDVHAGDVADEPRPPSFEMLLEHVEPEYPRGMFRIALPLDAANDSCTGLLALVDDAMQEFPVHWGTAGYSFYWNDADTKVERYAEQWLGGPLLRHPGLATGDYLEWGSMVEDGIANIGWLTFVGNELLQQLGGRDAVDTTATGAGLEVRHYELGVGLQAGPRPELGDVNRGDLLPRHREVGRIVEPIFAPDDVLENINVTGIRDPDQRLAWLRRFLP